MKGGADGGFGDGAMKRQDGDHKAHASAQLAAEMQGDKGTTRLSEGRRGRRKFRFASFELGSDGLARNGEERAALARVEGWHNLAGGDGRFRWWPHRASSGG